MISNSVFIFQAIWSEDCMSLYPLGMQGQLPTTSTGYAPDIPTRSPTINVYLTLFSAENGLPNPQVLYKFLLLYIISIIFLNESFIQARGPHGLDGQGKQEHYNVLTTLDDNLGVVSNNESVTLLFDSEQVTPAPQRRARNDRGSPREK